MKLFKNEGAKTVCGIIVIVSVFVFAYVAITSPRGQEESNPLARYEGLGYLPGFPYHLPLLDIPITEDFDPWARRTGLQMYPEIFMHLLEFRLDQEPNTVHIKIGVTSPRYITLEQIVMTFRGHDMVWTHRNQDIWWLDEGANYFRFTLPIRYFRNEELGPMQWHLQEVLAGEGTGEILVFEATIER